MKSGLLGVAAAAERLHRRSLELLDRQLEYLGFVDLTATQAMILLHVGTQQITPTDLILRGYYQGTNVSYNLKKLITNGYIVQERSDRDLRVVYLRSTRKGRQLSAALEQFYEEFDFEFTDKSKIALSDHADKMAAIEQFFLGKGLQQPFGEVRTSVSAARSRRREHARLRAPA